MSIRKTKKLIKRMVNRSMKLRPWKGATALIFREIGGMLWTFRVLESGQKPRSYEKDFGNGVLGTAPKVW